ncbi:MarR family winged helix-turn-helix transcriptional regulator [Streptomyces sp. MI02-7b]|uniref:MarR family winged helix-turn-helix transcriptional regulator n=1 Tax=Streptomyces sp. MI02-7b TaxID=462941 RepID=UPI0029ACEADC|nr:MarR family transcriptional regulator [Streptomyces sp. MI02-7b]MDX3077882.1 MarR family transcriptional regulator [Streptomyces sp. MI02-7b]
MATITTPPPGLESHEEQTLRAFLGAARLLSEELGQELRRATGMRQIHYEILGWLEEAPGHRMAMGELARRAAVSASRLSHLVSKLEELSWVRRLHTPDDGRCHLAQLTDTGRAALREATPWHARYAQERLLDLLSREQVDQLRQISELLLSRPPGLALSDGAEASGQQHEPGAGTC